MNDYNYIDLFHGIGGFALGAYWAGMKFENHFCNDIEPYCQKLYKLRFPNSIQLGDITKIDTDELKKKYGNKWILTGGFPCQDISIAGKGDGIHGKRSGLWFEYWRLIRDLRPRFAIMENVRMLIYRGFREVLGTLAKVGYNAEWQTLSSCQFGLQNYRQRVWIVAYPSSFRLPAVSLHERAAFKNKWFSREYNCAIYKKKREISESDFTDKIDGISGKLDEFKGLGNAIVPQIAELLFLQIKDLL